LRCGRGLLAVALGLTAGGCSDSNANGGVSGDASVDAASQSMDAAGGDASVDAPSQSIDAGDGGPSPTSDAANDDAADVDACIAIYPSAGCGSQAIPGCLNPNREDASCGLGIYCGCDGVTLRECAGLASKPWATQGECEDADLDSGGDAADAADE